MKACPLRAPVLLLVVRAVMSPSDAVATSNVKKAGVNRRVISILDGEGLINDAGSGHPAHGAARREGAVIVWPGMRGAVRLAAAQTIPVGTWPPRGNRRGGFRIARGIRQAT